MSESNAISAHGTIVKLNGVAIGELRDITPPALTRKTIETTNHNSDDASFVRSGVRRKSELQMNIGFVHEVHEALVDAWDTGTKDRYDIEYPDGASWMFSGFVTNIAPKQPVDGGQEANVSVQPSGGHQINF